MRPKTMPFDFFFFFFAVLRRCCGLDSNPSTLLLPTHPTFADSCTSQCEKASSCDSFLQSKECTSSCILVQVEFTEKQTSEFSEDFPSRTKHHVREREQPKSWPAVCVRIQRKVQKKNLLPQKVQAVNTRQVCRTHRKIVKRYTRYI